MKAFRPLPMSYNGAKLKQSAAAQPERYAALVLGWGSLEGYLPMDRKSYANAAIRYTNLLESLSQGDSGAFWELWFLHQDYLYQCCLEWMGGDVTDAQDAMSQAMLKAWDRLPLHAHKIINLKAWLARFVHNLCMDIHRERGRKEIGIDNIESPASELLSSEIKIAIRSVIEALPIRLQSPFVMRFEQDLSCLDIAQKLNISLDNVYKRISQARAILKPQMQKYLSEEEDSDCLEISLSWINTQEATEANLNQGIQQDLLATMFTQVEAGSEALRNRGMQCLYCLSTHMSKNGNRRGKQNYLCQQCDRQFVDSYSTKGYSPEVRECCLKLFADGMGYREIGRKIGVSHNTIKNWVNRAAT
jgi:RNA polymerase sigma factor (sigma-70 family)